VKARAFKRNKTIMEKQKLNKAGISEVTRPLRWLFITALLFFISLGSIDFVRAWIYFGCYFIGFLINSYILVKKLPGLANERGEKKQGTKNWDTPILFLYFQLYIIITPITAGTDIRYNIYPLPYDFLYLGIGCYIIFI
jgi:hypothetical protein